MKVYLGADHGGFQLKEEMKEWLNKWHVEFADLGASNYIPEDDYPDYAWPVALKVAKEPGSFGILTCRSGQGECIVANKAKGVRAAIAWTDRAAFAARNDDDANVLCLPADYISLEEAEKIIYTFIFTPFKTEDRYKRRLDKVKKIDLNL